MLNQEQKKKFAALRVEIIDLNILACFYVRKINRLGYLFQNSTRHYVLEELTALRYMENGLILHLTNLDDDSSDYSFRRIPKAVDGTLKSPKQTKQLKNKLDEYRKLINSLKVQHRNERIAHLNHIDDLAIDQFLNFNQYLKPIISEALQIGDLIWGRKIEYKFKLGSMEGILDYRKIFDALKFDIHAQREFT